MTTMRIATAYTGRIPTRMILRRLAEDSRGVQVHKVKQQLMRRGIIRKLTE